MSRLEDSAFDPTIGVSNDLKYSLTRESMLALVAKEDLLIVYPKTDELFIDHFAEGKKIGRPKQEWHWDFVELNPDDTIKGGRGHWRKV